MPSVTINQQSVYDEGLPAVISVLLPNGAMAELPYYVQPPTGNDDAILSEAFASGKEIVLGYGTYICSIIKTIPSGLKLRGRGIGKTVIKIANGSNLANLLVASGTTPINDVSIEDLTLDGNHTGNVSGNQCVLYTSGAQELNRFILRNCEVKNGRGVNTSMGTGYSGVGRGLKIEGCHFTGTRLSAIDLASARDVIILGNHFTGYNQAVGNNPAIGLKVNVFGVEGMTVTGNTFRSETGNEFAIEGIASESARHKSITVTGNTFDGNNVGGTGLSLQGHNMVVSGNTFIKGSNNQRSGIEMGGDDLVCVGNLMENGAIVISPVWTMAGFSKPGKRHTVTGNIIKINTTTAIGLVGITMVTTSDVICMGNVVEMEASGAGGINCAIMLNVYGGSISVDSAGFKLAITNNILRSTTLAGVGIRSVNNGGDFIDNVLVAFNRIDGFATGIGMPSDGSVTDTRIMFNDLSGCTTPISGTPTGSGYVEFGNKHALGDIQITQDASQGFIPASGSTVTINCRKGLQANITLPAGNITVAAPSNAKSGMQLAIDLLQDTVGGRTVTWNSIFKKSADGTGGANQRGCIMFRYNGVNWVQVSAALTYFS